MIRYVLPSVLFMNCLLVGHIGYAQTTSVAGQAEKKKTATDKEPVVKGSYIQTNKGRTTIIQTDNNGLKYRFMLEGEVAIADDERSITSITTGGRFEYSRQPKGELEHKVIITPNNNGQLQGQYWIGDVEKDYGVDGVNWLAQYLPEMVTKTGIGAAARAERLFKEGGISKVLSFTATMPAGMGRDRMYRYLLEKETLTADEIKALLEQVAKVKTSDHELARMLTHIPASLVMQSGVAAAYVKASLSISSDYEKARTLKHLLTFEQLSESTLSEVAKGISTISSDYEKVGVLLKLASRPQLLDEQFVFAVKALEHVSSDYERAKGLTAFLRHEQQVINNFNTFLPLIKSIGSDYEKAKVYAKLLDVNGVSADYYVALLKDSESIGSDYEKSKLLQKVAKQMPKENKDVREAYLQTAKTIGSSHEYERAVIIYKQ